MKTIRVIDLLNKIANKEEVPKKIKYGNTILINEYNALYKDLEGSYLIDYLWYNLSNLNDEVEIIEDTPKEDKKIKRIEERESWWPNMADGNVSTLKQAINEIIDRLNGDK